MIVISILTLCNHRSDDSSRLSFLRTRTLGDRIRDTRTWARNRRQSQEKEASPQEAGGQETGGQESRDAPETEEKEEPGEMFGSQSRLSDSASASPGSRLSRIFSLRRSSEPPSFNEKTHPDNPLGGAMTMMHPLAEEDEALLGCSGGPMSAPPSLPPPLGNDAGSTHILGF